GGPGERADGTPGGPRGRGGRGATPEVGRAPRGLRGAEGRRRSDRGRPARPSRGAVRQVLAARPLPLPRGDPAHHGGKAQQGEAARAGRCHADGAGVSAIELAAGSGGMRRGWVAALVVVTGFVTLLPSVPAAAALAAGVLLAICFGNP